MYEDFPEGWAEETRRFCAEFPARLDEYKQLLTRNRIWMARTQGVGVIAGDVALDYGMTGPCLRASGVDYDVRRALPYSGYEQFDFDVPLGTKGDTYDRYLVRLEEMLQSRRIVLQGLDRLPDGEIRGKVSRRIRPPKGEVYHSNEGPKGELGVYLVSDGSENAYRCRFRSPCFVNLQALPELARGHLVADVVALIGTLDIVLGCVDR
jgi:NADH-quinone oxidoreductase subunit D